VKKVLIFGYAIPFTWDVTKQLPNYSRISRAGQVLAPKVLGQAIAAVGLQAH
jgi:hypothetical protein